MQTSHATQGSGPGYETRDANARSMIVYVVVLFATLAGTFVFSWGLYRFFQGYQSLGEPAAPYMNQRVMPSPADPLIQAEPRQDLLQYQAREKSSLNSYDWVNPKSGLVKIPIDRAMDLLMKKGLPVYQGQPVPPYNPQAPTVEKKQ